MLTRKQRQVLKFVVGILQANQIPFQITGGLAAIAYGSRRPLDDIDLDVYQKDIPKVKELFKDWLVEDFHHLQDYNLDLWLMTLSINGVGVDICQAEHSYYVGKDGRKIRLDADLSRVKTVKIDGIEFPVEDKQELIAYKKILATRTDLEDIRQIG